MSHKNFGLRGEPMPPANDGSPDSHRPSGLCPRCLKQSSFEHAGFLPLTFSGGYIVSPGSQREPIYHERMALLLCRHCNQGLCVLEEQWIGEHRAQERAGGGTITWRGFHWWPLPGAKLHESVPDHIRDAFNEAVVALAANCPRAAAVMARRTLEAIATEKGEASGTLSQRLHNLMQKGHLHPSLGEWVKEVRLVGNSGAHYDPLDRVERADAEDLVSFIHELLNYLYVLPFDLNKRRNKRT